jgi:hypothetical protein
LTSRRKKLNESLFPRLSKSRKFNEILTVAASAFGGHRDDK